MNKDFELFGSVIEARTAKQQIAKYFKCYGDAGDQEAKKQQLIFASKIMYAVTKCENKHSDIYCSIIENIFADHLHPEASSKHWTIYVNCLRYFHFQQVEMKDFEKASLIYTHISSYSNKLQNTENALTCINIFCYHLILKSFLKSQNQELAIREATEVVENLTKLFNEMLEKNIKNNFQYPDVLNKASSWLFPHNKAGPIYHFLKILPVEKVKRMFESLFRLYGCQKIDVALNEKDVQSHANFIIETIYTLLHVDIMDKMRMQLSIQLMAHCRTEIRLQSNKVIADLLLLFYDYLKLLCAQESTVDFQRNYSIHCERFKELFDKYSKSSTNQLWFGDYLVLIFYLHSQLQYLSIYSCFWKQMCEPDCFKSMFKFFMELMKLAPCISTDLKLFTVKCCNSARKHVILSFAQITLTGFAFYCENITEDGEKQENTKNLDNHQTNYYKEMIQNNIILILSHCFKIIDRMDCITSNSQEIEIILTRFKQATLNCKTSKQAATCILICELFSKIKTKIPSTEWPLLLRCLYKTISQLTNFDPLVERDIQMCYIVSLLHDGINQIDVSQIRRQINIFYNGNMHTEPNKEKQQQHEHCLLHLYYTTSLAFRPHLGSARKKLLHWLESQHILKYHKSNTVLVQSVLKYSMSHYDFVLITKLGNLETYAMTKINSLYRSLKLKAKELSGLSRLEQLIFGHLCAMLLNDMNSKKNIQLDSKDLYEDQLENLLAREEMTSFTIYNNLKRFKLAWEAFKAFETFFERFDSEAISMDDAFIDWDTILSDLSFVALYLQLSGFLEHSSQAWLLHYKCSRLIHDHYSAFRGLAFFCEYSELYGRGANNNKSCLDLEKEIQYNFPTIIQGLENLPNIQRQAYQSYILLAVVQIAYYYARSSRFTFAQMLFQYAEQKHSELPERKGRYDVVLATMDVVKFRLLWKNFNDCNAMKKESPSRTTAENLLLHRCLLHEIEAILDRFYDFSHISSVDSVLHSILIISLTQELAECAANRLCDNFLNSFFIGACKLTLVSGLALRFAQVMSMWLWVNLQMEYVDKAQVKLKIIEYVMGTKSLKELTKKCLESTNSIKSKSYLPIQSSALMTPNHHNLGVETMRRLAQVQLSPVKTSKLQLSPSHQNSDLKRYFKLNIGNEIMPQNEHIEWILFLVGCLNARLYFLVEDYGQLETFYENSNKWLQKRQNNFNKIYYKNIQVMVVQHYANFLRARQQYDKAMQCLNYGISLCKNERFYIDAVYHINLQLQIISTQKEILASKNVTINLPTHSKLRRALEFNTSPEIAEQLKKSSKSELKENKLQSVMESGKKTASVCRSTKKIKKPAAIGPSSSSFSSMDLKITKPKPKFKICEDSFETIDIIDDVITIDDATSIKRTKAVEESAQKHKTSKIINKTTKPSKTTDAKSGARSKTEQPIPKFHIDISLTDSPPTVTSAKSSTSIENLEVKENFNANELAIKMQNLDIKISKTTEISRVESERNSTKSQRKQKKPMPAVIILEDSPIRMEFVDKPKSSRKGVENKDNSLNDQENNEHNIAFSSRSRSQRKLIPDNTDKLSLQNEPPLTRTRKRQKNLV